MRDDEHPTTPHRDEAISESRPPSGSTPEQLEPAGARHERELELGADEAWELLGTSDGLERWLGDAVELEVREGAEGTIRDGEELLLTEVESVVPGRRVSLRWWSEERGASVVDLTLEPLGDRLTRLVVTEIPAEVLRAPASPATIGGSRGIGGGPKMLAAGAGRALALA